MRKRTAITLSFCNVLAVATLLAATPLQPGTGFGLRGQYFNNKELRGAPSLIRTDSTINFVLGQRGPGFGINDNQYSVRWNGDVEAPVTGSYTFTTMSDDGVRLWVNGKKIIDNWSLHGPKRDVSQPVTLEGGKRYDIVLEYYENLGGSTIQLFWKTPGQNAAEIIPSKYLYPADSSFLSDLAWASAQSGWGPPEKDMSNGERAAGDGKPLQIGGRKFVKGLGVHPDSQIVYRLDEKYEFFATFAGIDDEVGNRGSARFQIWLDGVKVWETPKVDGDDQPRSVVLSVAGKRELKLVTTDGNDGSSFDHTDWADAQLVPVTTDTSGASFVFLSDMRWTSAVNGLGPVERDESNGGGGANDGKTLTIGGVVFKKGLGVHSFSDVRFALNGRFTSLLTGVGIDDEVGARGSGVFEIWADNVKVWDSGMVVGDDKVKYATINLTGKNELRLLMRDGGNGTGNDHGDWANARLTLPADNPPPGGTPAQVTGLQAAPGNTQVTLSWSAASGAASYNIYRGTVSGGEAAVPVATGVPGLSFVNTGLTNGTKYFYKVAAVNASGVGPISAEVSATPAAAVQVPGAVTELQAAPGNTQVSLSWKAVAGAATYNVYRGTAAGGEAAAPIATGIASQAFVNTNLTNGTQYFYKVAAVNAAGTGPLSAEVNATPVAPVQIPGVVTGLTATPGNAQVSLSWTAVAGAATYNVYRGTAAGGEAAAPIATGIASAAFVNTGLTNGTKYFYKVAAVNGAGTGPKSEEVSATPAAPVQIPPAVTGLTATPGNAQVSLAWTAIPTAATYNVYRGTAAGGEAAAPIATGIATAAFVNTGLTNGTQFFYKVTAVNTAGEGPMSAEVNATPVAPLQIPPAVTGLTATGGDTQVALSWTVVPTAATYNVYRGTAAGGESGTPIATGIATTAFTNTGLTNGTAFFYKVKAVNAAGTGPFSNEATATPAAPPPVITPDMISAARFLRSASWGPTQATIDRVKLIGIPAYIDEQIAAAPSVFPDTLFANIPDVEPTQEHFFRLTLTGQDQLRQRVAFALHKILVVSAVKVDDAGAIVTYLRIFQNRAFGNFLDVLKDVTLNPAMGHFLDMVNNRKAAGGVQPNENYAREVMQLFSLGLTTLNLDGTPQLDAQNRPIPTYGETDVTELARVLTGWTYNDGKTGAPLESVFTANFLLPMEPVVKYHDTGIKTILGQTIPANGTAQQDLDQALGIIFNHPNVGPFISKQLIQQLVTSNPSPNFIRAVATVFNNDGAGVRGNLQAVVKAILTNPEAQLGTPNAGKLKEPALFMTSIVRPLGASVVDHPFISDSSEEMGQKIYFPGSVFSYFSPNFRTAGILAPEFQIFTTVTATSRANFIARLITGGFGADVTLDLTPFTSIANDAAALADKVNLLFLGGQMSSNLRTQIITAASVTTNTTERTRTALYLALVSNEFQVDH
jgi:uncharacterized protein (DUF1800 family)/fibronectin type 3 domain-containing protein